MKVKFNQWTKVDFRESVWGKFRGRILSIIWCHVTDQSKTWQRRFKRRKKIHKEKILKWQSFWSKGVATMYPFVKNGPATNVSKDLVNVHVCIKIRQDRSAPHMKSRSICISLFPCLSFCCLISIAILTTSSSSEQSSSPPTTTRVSRLGRNRSSK